VFNCGEKTGKGKRASVGEKKGKEEKLHLRLGIKGKWDGKKPVAR